MLELIVGIPVVILCIFILMLVVEYTEHFLGLAFLWLWLFIAYKVGEHILS